MFIAKCYNANSMLETMLVNFFPKRKELRYEIMKDYPCINQKKKTFPIFSNLIFSTNSFIAF